MKIEKMVLGSYGTNCYVVFDEQTRHGIVIDPGYTPHLVLARLDELGLTLDAILLTHGHFDHVGGARAIHEATGCKVYVHQNETELPEYLTAGPLCYTDFYGEGSVIHPAGLTFHVILTPGHTTGSVCLFCEDVMFSGDTLFRGNCGRTDGPGGDWEQMCHSLNRLSAIPKDYRVLSGHGPETTLRREQLYNVFMQEAARG